jgi:hypothetical protein
MIGQTSFRQAGEQCEDAVSAMNAAKSMSTEARSSYCQLHEGAQATLACKARSYMLPTTATIALIAMSMCNLSAQVTIFNTYENVTTNVPAVMEGYKLVGIDGGNNDVHLLLKGEGLPERDIACKDIWGFGLDSVVYRVVPGTGMPALLVIEGHPCFYENGGAHLRMYLEGDSLERLHGGHAGYLSDDLNSEMVGVGLQHDSNGIRVKRFLRSKPEYEAILKCLNQFYSYVVVRGCVLWQQQQGE